MLKKERYRVFVDYFSTHQPNAETELHFSNPFELLIAVILSAQCTDKRINQVTPKLFERYPNPEALATSTSDEVFSYIRSTSKATTPLAVEKQLVKYLPTEKIHVAHHWLILHGRYTCLARTPKCEQCQLNWMCKYYAQQQTATALLKAEKAAERKKVASKKKKISKTARILQKMSR
jgi:endonuclease III